MWLDGHAPVKIETRIDRPREGLDVVGVECISWWRLESYQGHGLIWQTQKHWAFRFRYPAWLMCICWAHPVHLHSHDSLIETPEADST